MSINSSGTRYVFYGVAAYLGPIPGQSPSRLSPSGFPGIPYKGAYATGYGVPMDKQFVGHANYVGCWFGAAVSKV